MPLRKTIRALLRHPVGARQRVRTVLRFARWQVRCRLRRSARVFRFVNDTRLQVVRGEHGITGNVYVGLHEFQEMALIGHLLRDGDLFVDIGANSGSFSVLAAAVGARVEAFEPVPESAARLRANIELNGWTDERVRLHQLALGAESGTVQFVTSLGTRNRMSTGADDAAHTTIEVPVDTLDHCLGPGARPVAIKIDVEGFESSVLAGASETLANPTHPLVAIIEANQPAESPAADGLAPPGVVETLRSVGFAMFHYDPFERRLTPTDQPTPFSNWLAVRQVADVQARLEAAPPLRVHPIGLSI